MIQIREETLRKF